MNKAAQLYQDAMEIYPWLDPSICDYHILVPGLLLMNCKDGTTLLFNDLERTLTKIPSSTESMTKEQANMMFGILLRNVMSRKGITQQQLSELTGITQCQISKYTYGVSSPSFYTLDKIVRALGCSAEDLRYVK